MDVKNHLFVIIEKCKPAQWLYGHVDTIEPNLSYIRLKREEDCDLELEFNPNEWLTDEQLVEYRVGVYVKFDSVNMLLAVMDRNLNWI